MRKDNRPLAIPYDRYARLCAIQEAAREYVEVSNRMGDAPTGIRDLDKAYSALVAAVEGSDGQT